jgi:hypothetical protein
LKLGKTSLNSNDLGRALRTKANSLNIKSLSKIQASSKAPRTAKGGYSIASNLKRKPLFKEGQFENLCRSLNKIEFLSINQTP